MIAIMFVGCDERIQYKRSDIDRIDILVGMADKQKKVGSLDEEGMSLLFKFCKQAKQKDVFFLQTIQYLEAWQDNKKLFLWGIAYIDNKLVIDISNNDASSIQVEGRHACLIAPDKIEKEFSEVFNSNIGTALAPLIKGAPK